MLKSGFEIPPGTVIFEDPPTHTIHRKLLSRMFTPRSIAELEPQIRQLCCEFMDPLVGSGGFDWIGDFGRDIPSMVISMLIGIPESDMAAIRQHFEPVARTRAASTAAARPSTARCSRTTSTGASSTRRTTS